MNDLYFINYEAKLMFLDTSDMTCEGERAHRRLCDYIWFSDRPPLNNNESLRQITHTDASKWGKVKVELIAKGWLEKAEYLLHRGVINTLNESKKAYVANSNRTAKANGLKPLQLTAPDRITGIVTILNPNDEAHAASFVTPDATLPVTAAVTLPQSESESVNEERERRPTEVVVPSWEEVKAWAQMDGVPEPVAREFFDHENSYGQWRAGGRVNGMPINGRNAMKVWFNRGRKINGNNSRTRQPGADRNKGYNENYAADNAGADSKVRGTA